VHIEEASSDNGILNHECAVLSPDIFSTAMPDNAVARAIRF